MHIQPTDTFAMQQGQIVMGLQSGSWSKNDQDLAVPGMRRRVNANRPFSIGSL